MSGRTILFLSNGFAEDTLGAALARQLRALDPQLKLYALPIVGKGEPYEQAGVTLLGPRWELPSQGITYGGSFDLRKEIKAGAVPLYLGKVWALIRQRRRFDLVVGVGDFLSGVVSGVIVKKPFVYLWVTLSHFDWVAKYFLRKYAKMIFSRWRSWVHLREFKVENVGNPYMDVFEISGEDFGLDRALPTIAVLPGSREPAYNNLPKIIRILNLVREKRRVNIVIGLSPKIERERFLEKARSDPGWSPEFRVESRFGDVINVADLVLGLSGTANEQASGLGKPVVTFWGGGHSREEGQVKHHARRFLEGAAVVLPGDPELVADNILSLLSDPVKMKRMGECGRELNGGQGSLRIIAERINQWLKTN